MANPENNLGNNFVSSFMNPDDSGELQGQTLVKQLDNQAQARQQQLVQSQNDHPLFSTYNITDTSNPLRWAVSNAGNTVATVASRPAHILTGLASGIVNGVANQQEKLIPDEVKSAQIKQGIYAKRMQGIQDLTTDLNNQVARGVISKDTANARIASMTAMANQFKPTQFDLDSIAKYQPKIDHVNEYRSLAQQITGNNELGTTDSFNSQNWANNVHEQELQQQFKTANDEFDKENPNASNLSKALNYSKNVLSSVVDNPIGVGNTVANSIVDVISKRALFAGAASDAVDNYNQARQDLAKRRGVDALTTDEDREVTNWSTLVGSLNFLGDGVVHLASKPIKAVTGKSTEQLLESPIKSTSVLGNTIQSTKDILNTGIGRTVGAGAGEFIPEGLQQEIANNESRLKNEPFNVRDFIEGGTLGAVGGSAMAGTAHLGYAVGKIKETNQENKNITQGKNDSIEDNLDVSNKRFNPTEAIKKTFASNSVDDANTQSQNIISDLNTQLDALKAQSVTPEQKQTQLDDLNNQVIQLTSLQNEAVNNGDIESFDNYGSQVDALNTQIDQLNNAPSQTDLNNQIEKLQGHIDNAVNYLDVRNKLTNNSSNPGSSTFSRQESLKVLDDPEASQEDIDKAFDNIINHPMIATPEQLDKVINSPNVSDEIKGRLREASDLLKQVKGTSISDTSYKIRKGDANWKSLEDFTNDITDASVTGNDVKLEANFRRLSDFADAMNNKAQAVQEALDYVKGTDKKVQVLNVGNGQWEVNKGKPVSGSRFRNNIGLLISDGYSNNLVSSIQDDAQAVRDTYNNLYKLTSLNSNAPSISVPTETNTVNTPQEAPVVAPTEVNTEVQPNVPVEANQAPTSNESIPEEAPLEPSMLDDYNYDNNLDNDFNPLDQEDYDAVNQTNNAPVNTPVEEVKQAEPKEEEITNNLDDDDVSVDFDRKTDKVKADSTKGIFIPESNLKFTQKLSKAGTKALIAVKDFITTSAKNYNSIDFLSQLSNSPETFSREDVQDINKFTSFATQDNIIKALDSLLDQTSLDDINNLASTLFDYGSDGKATASENLKTAIKLSLFNMMADHASSPVRTDKEVKLMIGIDKDAKTNADVTKPYKNTYGMKNVVIESLGKDVLKVLGISAKNTAKANDLAKLARSLGFYVYELGLSTKYLQDTNTTKGSIYKSLVKGTTKFYQKGYLANALDIPVANPTTVMKDLARYIELQDKLEKESKYSTIFKPPANFKPQWKYGANHTKEFNELASKLNDVITALNAPVSLAGIAINPSAKTDSTIGKVSIPAYHVKQAIGETQPYNNGLSKVFGIDGTQVAPLLKPVENTQTNIRNSKASVSPVATKLINKIQSKAMVLKPVADTFTHLYENNRDLLNRLQGIDYGSVKDVHISIRGNTVSTYQNQEREADLAHAFIKNSLKTPTGRNRKFYQELVVWSNQRIGYKSNIFNPQTSKYVRAISTYENNTTKITRTADEAIFNADGSLTPYGSLLHGASIFAEGITKKFDYGQEYKGGKTIDKALNAEILPRLHDYINSNEDFKNALDTATKISNKESITEQESNNLVAVVNLMAGNTGLTTNRSSSIQSFEALLELAKYSQLKPRQSFTSYLTAESDGITNGVIIAQIMSGTATLELLNKGGLITKDVVNKANNWFDLKAQGLSDHYEAIGNATKVAANSLYEMINLNQEVQQAMDFFADYFGSRAGGKKAGTPDNYGRGFPATIEGAGNDFIEAYIDKVAKTITEEDHAKLVKNTSVLIKFYNTYLTNKTLSEKDIRSLSNDNKKALVKYMSTSHNLSLLPNEGTFIDTNLNTKEQLNQLLNNYSFVLSRVLKESDLSKINTEKKLSTLLFLMNKSKGNPITELNLGEPGTVMANMPINFNVISALHDVAKGLHGVPTTHGLNAINSNFYAIRDVNIDMTQQAFQLSQLLENAQKATLVDSKIRKGQSPDLTVGDVKHLRNINSKYAPVGDTAISSQDKENNTGLFFESTEGKVLQGNDYNQSNTLNGNKYSGGVYVENRTNPTLAGNSGVTQSTDGSVSLNTIAETSALNFHDSNGTTVGNVVTMAQVQNEAFAKDMYNFSAQETFARAIGNVIKGFKDKSILFTDSQASLFYSMKDEIIENINAVMEAELAKLNLLDQISTVQQYGTEGGQFNPTPEMIAKNKARIESIENNQSYFDQLLDEVRNLEIQTVPAKNILGAENTPKDQPTVEDLAESNSLLGDLTKDGKYNIPKDNVINTLRSTISNPYYVELLNMVQDAVGDNVTINIFTPTNAPEHVKNLDNIAKGSLGWYNSNDTQINLIAHEGFTSEVVLHELLHAVTAKFMKDEMRKPKEERQQSSQAMMGLYSYIKKNNPQLVSKYPEAFKNVHEFISWGMTHAPLTNDLMHISMPVFKSYSNDTRVQNNLSSRLTSAYRAFVNTLSDLLHTVVPRRSKNTMTALDALITNTANIVQDVTSTDYNNTIKNGDDNIVLNQIGQQGFTESERLKAMKIDDLINTLDMSNMSTQESEHFADTLIPLLSSLHSSLGVAEVTKTVLNEVKPFDNIRRLKPQLVETSTKLASVGFQLNEGQQFMFEALSHSIDTALDNNHGNSIYREVSRAYESAKANTDYRMFLTSSNPTATEEILAKTQYNAVFKINTNNGKSSHLANFVALMNVSEDFRNKMSNVKLNNSKESFDNNLERVGKWINDLFDALTNKLSNSNSRLVKNSVINLTNQLAYIESKSKISKIEDTITSMQDWFNKLVDKPINDLRDRISTKSGEYADYIPGKSVKNLVKAMSNVGRGGLISIPEEAINLRNDENPNTSLNFLSEVADEFTHPRGIKKTLMNLLMLNTNSQREREAYTETTNRLLQDSFKDSASLTKADKKALTNVLMRTGVSKLLNNSNFNINDIMEFLSDSDHRKEAIDVLTDDILTYDHGSEMVLRVKDTAAYSASNKSNLMVAKSTYNVANRIGTGGGVSVAKDSRLVQQLDTLHALLALEYSDKAELNIVRNLVNSEGSNLNNGITSILNLHNQLSNEIAKTSFNDNPYSQVQSFTPEITNHYVDLRFASTEEESKQAIKDGYTSLGTLRKSFLDKNLGQKVELFVTKEGEYQRVVDGNLMTNTTGRKGTKAEVDSIKSTARIQKEAFEAKLRKTDVKFYDPRKTTDISLVPSFDTDGSVKAFSYEADNVLRDKVLERNNDVFELMSAYAGNNLDSINLDKVNNKVVRALFDDFQTNYIERPQDYVQITPYSSDPKLQEIYKRLPYKTRQEFHKLFGDNPITVNNKVLNLAFGYKKYALSSIFDKAKEDRNYMELAFSSTMSALFGDNARRYTVVGQRVSAEIVAKVKDIVVIRNVTTLVNNIGSNIAILLAYGVNPIAIARDTKKSLELGLKYRKDYALLIQAKQKLKLSIGNQEQNQQMINKYENELNRNPLKKFIESGTMSSIVEDISLTREDYSYESALESKGEALLNQLPDGLKTTASYLMVSPETPIHKFLTNATAMSDFVAKYVMYEHLMKKGGNHWDSIFEANEAFINYDVPTNKYIQFLNDMGLMMFTKFGFRIQRVLYALMRKNPASVLFQSYVLGLLKMPTIFDSFMPANLNNPLRIGALQGFDVWDEPFPIKIIHNMLS